MPSQFQQIKLQFGCKIWFKVRVSGQIINTERAQGFRELRGRRNESMESSYCWNAIWAKDLQKIVPMKYQNDHVYLSSEHLKSDSK